MPNWILSLLLGPEVFWTAAWFASNWVARRNAGVGFAWNGAIEKLMWLGPPALIVLTFALVFEARLTQLSWWMLVRLVLAGAVGAGACATALAEGLNYGSANPGVGMALLVVWFLHTLLAGAGGVCGMVSLIRANRPAAVVAAKAQESTTQPMRATGGGFGRFAKQAALVLGGLVVFFFVAGVARDRSVAKMRGIEKARALSIAHGRSIDAKNENHWQGDRANWNNFVIVFVEPNSVRLEVTANYREFAITGDAQGTPPPKLSVGDPERTLAAMNGAAGAVYLKFIGAKRKWQARWDDTGENLIWATTIDMDGLSPSRFIDDGKEAARLFIGPLAFDFGNGSWFLAGEGVEAGLAAGEPGSAGFALAWMEMALRQAAVYHQRGVASGEIYENKLGGRSEEAVRSEWKARLDALGRLAGEAAAARRDGEGARRLAANVRRMLDGWDERTTAASGFGFLMNGSLKQVRAINGMLEQVR